MRKRQLFAALGAVFGVLVLSSGAATTTGCQDRQCLFSAADWGRNPGQGALIDEDTWESSPMKGNWLAYPGRRAWFFFPRGLEFRKIASVVVYISPRERPNDVGNQFTIASGNVATIRTFDDPADVAARGENAPDLSQGVSVGNDTCADFFVRIVVRAYPKGVSGPLIIEGGDAGADATLDAPADTASDDALGPDADAATDGAPE